VPERSFERGAYGWDGPVEIVPPGTVDWKNDAKTLAALIQDSAPVKSGQLKTDLSLRRAGYSKIRRGKNVAGFQLVVHNAYAEIQDLGGPVPDRAPTGGPNPAIPRGEGLTADVAGDRRSVMGTRTIKVLHWTKGGQSIFATKARGFDLPGQQYLQRGVDRWLAARGHTGLSVAWAPREGEAAA
jgi:hypothetical protein